MPYLESMLTVWNPVALWWFELLSGHPYLKAILGLWGQMAMWWLAFLLVFTILARWTPCNPGQPIIRKGMVTDAMFGLVSPLLNGMVRMLFLANLFGLIFYNIPPEEISEYFTYGFGPAAQLPLWQQALIAFILSDILIYWGHRLFHKSALWKWHAIHHSSEVLDWLSTHRFHPVNVWFTFVLAEVIMLGLGFSPYSLAAMAGINIIYSAMVHANLNWTFGPFRYVFASPVFHRWHHTAQEEGLDKNFAPTFPIIDVVFGTFYMPKGRVPEVFGVPGSGIPESFLGQLAWPFMQERQQADKAKTETPPATGA
jgi:sterol desaturase/sphingolipid hydroxylase (fatty acid hydroxylase superfamily)